MAYVLLQSLVVPALPTLQAALHTSQSTVSWIFTAYLLSASVATPVLGRLGDMFGKERMLVVVLAALSAGSLVAALTSSIGVMIAARVLQGLGGAVFPLAFGIIRDEFPRERVAGAIGGISTLLGVGSGLGHRARRADRRPPELPLAVLDPARDDGDRDRGDVLLRARVAREDARDGELPGGGRSCRAG